jgi:molecular chaperone DnaK (HSP70)
MRATIDYGIDLGTSNSAVAVQDGTTPRLLPAEDGSVLLPGGPSGPRGIPSARP